MFRNAVVRESYSNVNLKKNLRLLYKNRVKYRCIFFWKLWRNQMSVSKAYGKFRKRRSDEFVRGETAIERRRCDVFEHKDVVRERQKQKNLSNCRRKMSPGTPCTLDVCHKLSCVCASGRGADVENIKTIPINHGSNISYTMRRLFANRRPSSAGPTVAWASGGWTGTKGLPRHAQGRCDLCFRRTHVKRECDLKNTNNTNPGILKRKKRVRRGLAADVDGDGTLEYCRRTKNADYTRDIFVTPSPPFEVRTGSRLEFRANETVPKIDFGHTNRNINFKFDLLGLRVQTLLFVNDSSTSKRPSDIARIRFVYTGRLDGTSQKVSIGL